MSFVLTTDLDGTILGDDEATHRFTKWVRESRTPVDVVYASGRFCESVRDDIDRLGLPEPLAIIGGVGSEICFDGELDRSVEWMAELSHHWDAAEVRERLRGLDWLEMQPDEFQSPFKVSYYFNGATEEQLEEIRRRLDTPWLRAELIYSSQRDLDVLPRGASKGGAAAFVLSFFQRSPERMIVSGDSGNDKSLFEHGFPGIVVANAQEELRQLSASTVYHASKPFADGVIEGLDHWMRTLTSQQAKDASIDARAN